MLRCCLSISLPICSISHEREGREHWGSVTLPQSWLIQLGLLALRYQGDWHLTNASRRWRNQYGRGKGRQQFYSAWSWRAKAGEEEGRWNIRSRTVMMGDATATRNSCDIGWIVWLPDLVSSCTNKPNDQIDLFSLLPQGHGSLLYCVSISFLRVVWQEHKCKNCLSA